MLKNLLMTVAGNHAEIAETFERHLFTQVDELKEAGKKVPFALDLKKAVDGVVSELGLSTYTVRGFFFESEFHGVQEWIEKGETGS